MTTYEIRPFFLLPNEKTKILTYLGMFLLNYTVDFSLFDEFSLANVNIAIFFQITRLGENTKQLKMYKLHAFIEQVKIH